MNDSTSAAPTPTVHAGRGTAVLFAFQLILGAVLVVWDSPGPPSFTLAIFGAIVISQATVLGVWAALTGGPFGALGMVAGSMLMGLGHSLPRHSGDALAGAIATFVIAGFALLLTLFIKAVTRELAKSRRRRGAQEQFQLSIRQLLFLTLAVAVAVVLSKALKSSPVNPDITLFMLLPLVLLALEWAWIGLGNPWRGSLFLMVPMSLGALSELRTMTFLFGFTWFTLLSMAILRWSGYRLLKK